MVVVGRLGEYDGGAGERLVSGDTDLLELTLLVVELLLLIRVVLGSTRMRCWILMSIVILMGRHSTEKKELYYLLFFVSWLNRPSEPKPPHSSGFEVTLC